MIRILIYKVDLKASFEVVRFLVVIGNQILAHLYLELKEVTLPYTAYILRNVSFYMKIDVYKS